MALVGLASSVWLLNALVNASLTATKKLGALLVDVLLVFCEEQTGYVLLVGEALLNNTPAVTSA
jgi:hypothetical protein